MTRLAQSLGGVTSARERRRLRRRDGATRRTSQLGAIFSIKEALEAVLGRAVNLVSPSALENPYFAVSVRQTSDGLYAT